MNKQKDAYGQEVLAYLKGEKVPEIVEREDNGGRRNSNISKFARPGNCWICEYTENNREWEQKHSQCYTENY